MSKGNQLYDKEKVFAGLLIFLILVTFPLWYTLFLGKATSAPILELSAEAKAAQTCIRPATEMRADHMQILDIWRDSVVRKGQSIHVSADGKTYEMSLSNTCMECHSNKAEFCDRCHTYVSVDPYCWDCHIANPKENK